MKKNDDFEILEVNGIVSKIEDAKAKLVEQKENLQSAALISFLAVPTLFAAFSAKIDENSVVEQQPAIKIEMENDVDSEIEDSVVQDGEVLLDNNYSLNSFDVNTIDKEDSTEELFEALEDIFDTDDDITVLKNNEYTAYKLTTEVTKENDEWSLIGTLNKEFVSELINLNVDSEAEELGIWQEKFLDESGNWQMSSDITYSVEKPELGLENEDWVKIGQEYMAVINTNYNTLHLYASEDEDSMIITDPVFSNSISLLDKMKLQDLGELSKIGNIVEVKLDSTLSNNKIDNEVLSKNETTIESHEYNIDGVQRVINVDDKGNSEESFITGNVDGLTDVVIDLEDGSVSYSQDDDGRSK